MAPSLDRDFKLDRDRVTCGIHSAWLVTRARARASDRTHRRQSDHWHRDCSHGSSLSSNLNTAAGPWHCDSATVHGHESLTAWPGPGPRPRRRFKFWQPAPARNLNAQAGVTGTVTVTVTRTVGPSQWLRLAGFKSQNHGSRPGFESPADASDSDSPW